jgi:hypothetical protein
MSMALWFLMVVAPGLMFSLGWCAAGYVGRWWLQCHYRKKLAEVYRQGYVDSQVGSAAKRGD